MNKRILALLLITFSYIGELYANEGMWFLPLLEKQKMMEMKKMGLKLKATDIYSYNNSSLKDAVVMFGQWCTGEIVSSKGLIFTNHHCGFDIFQKISTYERNILKKGYWANSYAEEIPIQSLSISFLVKIVDVSKEAKAIADTISNKAFASRKLDKILSKKYPSSDPNCSVSLEVFDRGNQYFLFYYKTYSDVRLTGVPPQGIGKFGGDTDNWMWPRQTGDFSVFRVYGDKNGNPAKYSPNNVPLETKSHLKISQKGVKEGDFTMVMGYPGSTVRYLTESELKEQVEVKHAITSSVRDARQRIMMEDMRADDRIQLMYSSKYFTSSNAQKLSEGIVATIGSTGAFDQKRVLEQRFTAWVNSNPAAKAAYGDVLPTINSTIEKRRNTMWNYTYLEEAITRGCEVFISAIRLQGIQRDLAGNKKIADKSLEQLRSNGTEFFKDYHPATDKRATIKMLELVKKNVDKEFLPDFFTLIEKDYNGSIAAFVNRVFDTSLATDSSRFFAFLKNPQAGVIENDLGYVLAKSQNAMLINLKKYNSDDNDAYRNARAMFIKGIQEMDSDKAFYPDANFTMRLSYGKVVGYEPKDGQWNKPFTTTKGILEKENPKDFEFEVPEKEKQLILKGDYGPYGEKDGTMRVCFLTDNDITGGNSGSPVIDGKGELVGIAFDGVSESLSGDLVYVPAKNRTICVDIRYVMFAIDKVAGAKWLVDEMLCN
jgi:hypothetical protein